jgi:hypothetical protein
MIRTLTQSLRLMGATAAVAAVIAGFSSTAPASTHPVPAQGGLTVATSFIPAGQ